MLEIDIHAQPDDVTCGPTSLHAVYNYYEDDIPLERVIKEVQMLPQGGTLAVMLGLHALSRGYKVHIYTFNLSLFDPTWFKKKKTDLVNKLREQIRHKNDEKLHLTSEAYIRFLQMGGEIKFRDLTRKLILKYLDQKIPILTGLSSTYLYQEAREIYDTNESDDIKGTPAGHFIVLSGHDPQKRQILIADPLNPNPLSKTQYYCVKINRLLNAILLGLITYDSNLLIIEPK